MATASASTCLAIGAASTDAVQAVKNTIDVLVSAEELETRRKAWKRPAPRVTSGALWKYTQLVSDASHGFVSSALDLG